MTRNIIWSAVVVRSAVSWFAARRLVQHTPTPSWSLTDPARLVAYAGDRLFAGGAAGVVLWQPGVAPANRERWTDLLLAAALEYGWKSTTAGAKTGWFTFTRREGDGPVVLFGVGPWIAQHRTSLFRLDEPANVIAERLARYDELTGEPWRGTGGLSGCSGIRASHEHKARGGEPLWRWDKAPRDVVGCSFELRGSVQHRPMTDDERGMSAVYEFDTRAGYLAAAGVAQVGWSAPEHLGPADFDPTRCGYWTVRRDQLPAEVAGLPLRLLVRDGRKPLVTTTTPVMSWLAEHGHRPEVMDAWSAVKSGRYLLAWHNRIRDALTVGAPGDAAPAIKDTYARTVGMLGRRGGRIYRADWRDEIVDRARINLIRKVAGAGVQPLRWNVDAVWIASDEAPEVVGARLGAYDATLGRWRPEVGKLVLKRTMTPADYEARYAGRC